MPEELLLPLQYNKCLSSSHSCFLRLLQYGWARLAEHSCSRSSWKELSLFYFLILYCQIGICNTSSAFGQITLPPLLPTLIDIDSTGVAVIDDRETNT